MSIQCNKRRELPGTFVLSLRVAQVLALPRTCGPSRPRTLGLHSPIGSSLLTAYELLIGSWTGQDRHLQLPGPSQLSCSLEMETG